MPCVSPVRSTLNWRRDNVKPESQSSREDAILDLQHVRYLNIGLTEYDFAMTVSGGSRLAFSLVMDTVQFIVDLQLIADLRRPPSPLLSDENCPAVLSVMCLRGMDPFLGESLRRLFAQDYPNDRVRVVIDSSQEPALPLVEAAIRETGAEYVDLLVLGRRTVGSFRVSGERTAQSH